MALLADILARVRTEIGDTSRNFTFNGTGNGTTKSFYLDVKPVELNNLYVTVDNVPVAYPAGYSLENNTGILTFTTAPQIGSVIVVQGTTVRYFLDSDLTTFINTAVTQHTFNRTDAFGSVMTLNGIPPVEEYPLAILASIEALWALATDAAFDINITAPDGVVIPRAQRYQQLTGIIQQRTDQYKQLCSALNIGIWRIEMGMLRRTSRTTNKLIPVYMPQEIDDARRPERVYLQNDMLGRTPLPSYVQNYDISLYQGDSFECEFDFPFDITGMTFKAQIRTYPNAPALYATFTITTISTSSTLSKIKLSLSKTDTAYMPVRAFWDLQATAAADPTYEMTYLKGQVFTTQQVTLE